MDRLFWVAFIQRDVETLERCTEEDLALSREIGGQYEVADWLWNLGALAGLREEYGEHKRYYEEALAVFRELGYPPKVAGCLNNLGEGERAAELLGLVLGHPALSEEVRRYAKPILAMVRDSLPTGELEAALARGEALDLNKVVAEMADESEG